MPEAELGHMKTTSAFPSRCEGTWVLDERMARALSEKQTLKFSQSLLDFFFFSLSLFLKRAAFLVVLRKFRHRRALGVCTVLNSPPFPSPTGRKD